MNNVTINASDVEWQITCEGGILGLLNKTTNGTIDIPIRVKIIVSVLLFGIAPITITVKVANEEWINTGFINLFFVVGVQ